MQAYLLARNPNHSLTHGYLPAAHRLGLNTTILTDHPNDYTPTTNTRIINCNVLNHHDVITTISNHPHPDVILSNSDHLQTQTALAAAYYNLPGKDWRATLHTKNKALMRRQLARHGAGITTTELPPDTPTNTIHTLPITYPCVIKPCEGVASEDVILTHTPHHLTNAINTIRTRRPHDTLLIEEYLPGDLCTLETLGDNNHLHILGGFHTTTTPPPYFIETTCHYTPTHPTNITNQVLHQLNILGVNFGACHTEFIINNGHVHLIEVNYRSIGDQCDLLLAELHNIPYFEHVWLTHLGHPLPTHLPLRTNIAARIDWP
ncbi:ATP-grasp domain-containing protein, partial [Dermatophilus congolensis]